MSSLVFERFLSTPEMTEAFGEAAIVQGMLDFEAALARAQAAAGVIPASAGETIAGACRVEGFDLNAIVAASSVAGTLAIPLVKQLTAAVALVDSEAAGYVHWGSTSQDVIDTAMVLATRRALALIDVRLCDLINALFGLAHRHGDVPLLGRTLMQPAQVISFGFKLVSWVAPLVRCRERLARAAQSALKLQLGGAVGTLSVMGEAGAAVADHMAAALQLGRPLGAWHTQRDEWVALGCEVGVLCGALGKIAKDISLLAQGEIGEVAEPSGGGRGGSSAMPHKRNPVASMIALAAATRAPHRVAALLAAMPQEHERGLGNWQAELAEWPGLFMSAHGAVHALADAASGLVVDPQRMRANIDALQGLVFAEGASMLLARHVGKAKAHALLESLSKKTVTEQRHLLDVTLEAVAADPHLQTLVGEAELRAVFDADAAARRAGALASPQLVALAASHHAHSETDSTP
ncbi:MAG: 3-carboxy-cis,cis-muconate cycloisomerase [Burkholderiales bacterium]|nr:3-carboxy-cis,cis-muconate cycloisomerase [Burkholderiales bacterium]